MKPILHALTLLLTILSATVMYGCSDSEPDKPITTVSRTVLVYMVADNNLSGYASSDIDEMRRGVMNGTGLSGGRLLIYYSGPDKRPRLLEIDRTGKEQELAVYDAGVSSVSIERMQQVLNDTKALSPADSYGLVLWSHATGWMSETGTIEESRATETGCLNPQSFGYDGSAGLRMKLSSLADALDGNHFEFIYFDCCHMATVEVVYELRHVTDRIIASPTELDVEGMPYDLNINRLFASIPDLQGALDNTFDFYDRRYSDGTGYGCCISLLNTTAIENLAAATRAIFDSGIKTPAAYDPVKYFRNETKVHGIYDMNHYITTICSDPQLMAGWQAAFNDVVMSFRTTEHVFLLPAEHFAGLGCHIIRSQADVDLYGYTDTEWWTDVASHAQF